MTLYGSCLTRTKAKDILASLVFVYKEMTAAFDEPAHAGFLFATVEATCGSR
jgi:hypothetical protein